MIPISAILIERYNRIEIFIFLIYKKEHLHFSCTWSEKINSICTISIKIKRRYYLFFFLETLINLVLENLLLEILEAWPWLESGPLWSRRVSKYRRKGKKGRRSSVSVESGWPNMGPKLSLSGLEEKRLSVLREREPAS